MRPRYALSVSCPYCKVHAGEPCRDMRRAYNRPPLRPLKRAHETRRDRARERGFHVANYG